MRKGLQTAAKMTTRIGRGTSIEPHSTPRIRRCATCGRQGERKIVHGFSTGLGRASRGNFQHNKKLELSIPDAAQSVAGAPLCLLSGLAAQFRVGQAGRPAAFKTGATQCRINKTPARVGKMTSMRPIPTTARYGSRLRHTSSMRRRVRSMAGGTCPPRTDSRRLLWQL